MDILYLHGFQSSSNSRTIKYLRSKLKNNIHLHCFDLPHKPQEALEFIRNKIEELNIDLLIGTSLGGVYAYNFEIPKICINPAFQFELKSGHYNYLNNRINGESSFSIDDEDVNFFNNLCDSYIYRTKDKQELYPTYILIGLNDDYISFSEIDKYLSKNDIIQYHNFKHRLDNFIIDNVLINLIGKIIYNN